MIDVIKQAEERQKRLERMVDKMLDNAEEILNAGMTNEQYLRTCTTEKMAEELFNVYCDGRNDAITGDWESTDTMMEWLREKHNEKNPHDA